MAAELHDVGRIGAGEAVPGAQLLDGAAGLRHVAELIRAASGRHDVAQPVAARVLAATDAYITLAEGGDAAAALTTLQADAGTAFDPAVVAAIAHDAGHVLRAAA
jgi:response regulator RpfG family c-di-GMP phosphodiesterase